MRRILGPDRPAVHTVKKRLLRFIPPTSRRKRKKRQEERKRGKARGARPASRKRHRGSAPVPAGGNDSPRTPSAGRAGAFPAQRLSFDSLLLRETLRAWKRMPFVDCGPGGQAERGRFRKAACGPPPQCERVLPDPLTQADSVPACAGPSCQRKGLQDKGALCFGLSLIRRPFSEKIWLKRRMVFVCAETAAFQHRGFRLQKTTLFSRLHSASVYKKRPYALFCFRLRRMTVYQRSGAPGQPSGGRAGGCE